MYGERPTADPFPDDRFVIRLMPEWSSRWPLWEPATPTRDVGYVASPEMYGLSEELSTRLEDWQSFWETHVHELHGWDSPENEHRWLEEGDRLTEDLAAEVSEFADVDPAFR